MRAVVFEGVGHVKLAEIAAPSITAATDAVVRVRSAGICGSDLHFLHGKAPAAAGDVLGHEGVGVVEAVGEGVRRVRVGDRVVVAFEPACGRCWFCRHGQHQLCERGSILGAGVFGGNLPGTQAEFVRVPWADTNLLRISDAVDDEQALFVGDVLTTGYYAAALGGAASDDTVAVVGFGPVGYFAAQAARAQGAGRVFALEQDPARLALAERIGVIPIDVREHHPQIAMAEATGDRGADVVIEAVGHPSAFDTALEAVRRGGRVVVIGMYTHETTELQLGAAWTRALDLRFGGICPVQAWWDRSMTALRAGKIDPAPLVSHRLPLDEAALGYELFDRREATKVLLEP